MREEKEREREKDRGESGGKKTKHKMLKDFFDPLLRFSSFFFLASFRILHIGFFSLSLSLFSPAIQES